MKYCIYLYPKDKKDTYTYVGVNEAENIPRIGEQVVLLNSGCLLHSKVFDVWNQVHVPPKKGVLKIAMPKQIENCLADIPVVHARLEKIVDTVT